MGFVYEPDILDLNQFDGKLKGLKVRVLGMSMDDYATVSGAANPDGSIPGTVIVDVSRRLSRSIVEWNLEEPDKDLPGCPNIPVPITPEKVMAQSKELILQIAAAWLNAVAGVSPPLPETSDAGLPSVEESIPMEALSPSLAS